MGDILIYSDESGVFDNKHYNYFTFGGVICLGREERDNIARKYIHVEKNIRENNTKYSATDYELKATRLTSQDKEKLFRSLNEVYKFAVVISQKDLHQKIFENKYHKQRYLDYAYKIVIKEALLSLIENRIINVCDIDNLYFYPDQHSTATDGRYELQENLFQEFKYGTFNYQWNKFFEPLFPKLNKLNVQYCNSKKQVLVRAADIIANRIYLLAINSNGDIHGSNNLFIHYMPEQKLNHALEQSLQKTSLKDNETMLSKQKDT